MQQLSANATPKNEFDDFKAQGTIDSYSHVLDNERKRSPTARQRRTASVSVSI